MGRGEDREVIERRRNLDSDLFQDGVLEAFLFQEDGRISFANKKACQFFGFEKEEFSRLYLQDLLLQPFSLNDLERKGKKISYLVFCNRPKQRILSIAQWRKGGHLLFLHVRDLGRGRPQLSVRESQLLDLLADGANNGEIAHGLGIARTTTQQHIASLRDKLGSRTRAHIIERALSYEIIHPRGEDEISFVLECRLKRGGIEKSRISYIDANTDSKREETRTLLNGDGDGIYQSPSLDRIIYQALRSQERQYFIDKEVAFPWEKRLTEGWVDPLPGDRAIVRILD